jgi:cold shock CspA family protein
LKAREQPGADQAKRALIAANVLTYLLAWQDGVEHASPSAEAGWIYILSTREQPDILKIGMTTRSVAQRVKEINSATGVLIPYAARKVFRVTNASVAETELFSLLGPYRIRPDREFFRLPFGTAVRIIEDYLESSRMRLRRRGRIIWFDPGRGYGFITEEGAADVFLHLSQVEESDPRILLPGRASEDDLGYRPQGPCALRARLVDTP